MSRAEYVWGAKQYLAGFKQHESRIYNERFPWRSLASIGARLGKTYGIIFKFKTRKDGTRTITRVL